MSACEETTEDSSIQDEKCGFVRKGQVGGWIDYLNGEESAYLDEPIKRVIEAGGNVRCKLE